ncbi:g4373 [Coccomyxa viridis]|uniref:G4373 protein n=1 Tax=Coccomyxa viridis TaxID=1274662 RepID=A0ABP1FRN9_9CHLO
MNSQGWVWRELEQYKTRICEIGVDGHALYNLEDDVLEQDIRMQYRLHRKLFLDAVIKLQAAQPQGVHLPRTLWEYRKEFPIRASVYFSGLLAAPRLTIFWLLVSEREMVQRVHDAALLRLQVILGEARQGSVQGWGKASADGTAQQWSFWKPFGGLPVASFMGQSWIFWGMTAFLPGIQLFLYMALFFRRHPVAVLYCGVVGVLRTLSEGHAMYQLFTHPDMTAAEAFSSAICSHLMTPAINAALAVLQVGLSPVLPSGVCRLLFWLRCVPLPLLTLWADFAAWVPTSEEELRNIEDGAPPAGGRRLHRNLGRARREKEAHATHWPPALAIPQELEDDEVAAPEQFKCPITLAIMTEPALTPNGMTYERPAILKWLETRRHDPCTKAPLRKRHLAPNLALRGVIEGWVLEQCRRRGIQQVEAPGGRKPDLSTANVDLEAGTKAQGGSNLLHGEDLQTLHAGQSSQQELRQRVLQSRQQSTHAASHTGADVVNESEVASAHPAQNGATTLRGRIAGVDLSIRPLNPHPNAVVR